jgi:hypothetical protein
MRFSAEWQDPGVSASAELKATFCLLRSTPRGKRVSRFFDDRYGRAHDRIAMPAYPVAPGFARAWWSLLAGRSGTIRLRRQIRRDISASANSLSSSAASPPGHLPHALRRLGRGGVGAAGRLSSLYQH